MAKFINPFTDVGFKRIASLSKEERMMYDESLKVYRDNLAVREFNIQEGREIGRAEGRAEGRVEGRAEGREIGRAEERAKNLQTIKRLKQLGTPIEIIAQASGMSADEISAL